MAKFLIVYLGGNPPQTQEEGQRHFKRYKEWIHGLGSAMVSPANPLKNTHSISQAEGIVVGSQTAMSGFTIIECNSIEDAKKVSQSCPFLETGGTLEVSEMVEMKL
ncbi:hypothetical protein LNL84_04550 [Vibrio sp. ZSDZ34]|jgi:hypothetical protein|uniref:YCII-related domain-containing protein n=1 Tax=Vibrio gelatinilyticus TaxID=2893468 RepID=A0A9X1W9G3_9VIBR|nr:hypothetical protein [Vibrio gelatinilyticus]MCJ2376099.1 hypothetical protein [Vibrio gelatinilyticus]